MPNHPDLEAIQLPAAGLTAEAVLEKVGRHGLTIVPSFVQADALQRLREEFDWIVAQPAGKGIRDLELAVGAGRDLSLARLDASLLPATREFFGSPWMDETCRGFFDSTFELNRRIYVMKEVVGTEHIAQDLHFDVAPALKFFLYLTDTTTRNGAFSCVPGSHRRTRRLRSEKGDQITYDNRAITRDHAFGESEILPVEGPAGTLIVFSTEVWHRAGIVSEGERRVMRGHTYRETLVPAWKKLAQRLANGLRAS